MSYDIYLEKDGEVCTVKSHECGGTYQIGYSNEANLSVTYNYSFFFYNFLDKDNGIRWLYGKEAKKCISRLENAIEILGTHRHKDYWAATPGNAGHTLAVILEWAEQHPGAIFNGD